jgi:hypothetical protein
MLEKKFNIQFNHWLKAVYKKTGAYELKVTKTDSIPFDAVKDHQIAALKAAKDGVLVYKIPDVGLGQKPFDNICLSGIPAYIVIRYPSGRAYGIDVDVFIKERSLCDRKSLTEEHAQAIHSFCIA